MEGEILKTIKYPDDTLVIAGKEERLQEMMTRIMEKCEEYGMKINIGKQSDEIVKRGRTVENWSGRRRARAGKTIQINTFEVY